MDSYHQQNLWISRSFYLQRLRTFGRWWHGAPMQWYVDLLRWHRALLHEHSLSHYTSSTCVPVLFGSGLGLFCSDIGLFCGNIGLTHVLQWYWAFMQEHSLSQCSASALHSIHIRAVWCSVLQCVAVCGLRLAPHTYMYTMQRWRTSGLHSTHMWQTYVCPSIYTASPLLFAGPGNNCGATLSIHRNTLEQVSFTREHIESRTATH